MVSISYTGRYYVADGRVFYSREELLARLVPVEVKAIRGFSPRMLPQTAEEQARKTIQVAVDQAEQEYQERITRVTSQPA